MNRYRFLLVIGALLLLPGLAYGDARLEKKLGLNVDQARQVQAIQKQQRKKFSAKRQELNREMRKLRRARIAHDSQTQARQENITAQLEQELREIRLDENEQIRRLLTPEQRQLFEDVIRQRRASVGSSRDAKIFQ